MSKIQLTIKRPSSLLSSEMDQEITEEQLGDIKKLLQKHCAWCGDPMHGVFLAHHHTENDVDVTRLPRREGIEQYQAEDR